MSELATEIRGQRETVTTSELLGSTFQDRRLALQEVDAFREQARQALVDSVAVLAGKTVLMKFRPSSTTSREHSHSFNCYSIADDERKPLETSVTVQDVDQERGIVKVGNGEFADEEFDRTWWVNIGNILDITLETKE